jgi:two-component system, NarL family, response regulator NreC
MNSYRIIVAYNWPCMIQGILTWLNNIENVNSLVITSDWDEAKNLVEENGSDILIITEKWISKDPGIQYFTEYFSKKNFKVLCFVDKDTSQEIAELYECGIQCLISCNDSQEEFLWGIKALVNGKRHISSELLSTIKGIPFSIKASNTPNITLTKREKEILRFISQGHTNKEIADKLFISKRTVDGYREAILDKYGARNTAQLITMINGYLNS